MAQRKHLTGAVALAVTTLVLAACGGSDSSDQTDDADNVSDAETDADADADATEIAGDITVLTHRTDLVDTLLVEYKERFEEKYPDVNVSFEAITDYEGDLSIRINTEEYGDALMIAGVDQDQLADFFEPLGTVEELEEQYRFVREQSFEGLGYGIALNGNGIGYVFNRTVWEQAGITEPPTTPEEFLDALRAIQENTDAIPYYTNYGDGWPVGQWQAARGMLSGPDFENEFAKDDSPWVEGKDMYAIDSLMFDIVAEGLSEPDPTTTNWEESKNLLATGQIGTMVLGSWAVTQMREAAELNERSADEIGYWPLPFQVDGVFLNTVGGDFQMGINKHSDNKEAARAWIDWYTHESGFAQSQGGIPTTLDGDLPDSLSDFDPLDLEFIEMTPAAPGEESLLTDVYNTAEIDPWDENHRRRIIDVARGAEGGDKESLFAEFNERWAAAREQVSG